MGQNTAFEVAAELPLDVGRHRTAIPVAFAAKGKVGLEVLLHHPIEYCLGGTPLAVWDWNTSLWWFDGHAASLDGD
jgi:hypothetical protein